MAEKNKLCVIWTSGDPDVALSMVFMYAKNAKLKEWWEQVRLVVWGASSKLLPKNNELKEEFFDVQQAGVETVACRACADMHGVTEQLEDLDIDVIYMGQPLTEMLKSEDWAVVTF